MISRSRSTCLPPPRRLCMCGRRECKLGRPGRLDPLASRWLFQLTLHRSTLCHSMLTRMLPRCSAETDSTSVQASRQPRPRLHAQAGGQGKAAARRAIGVPAQQVPSPLRAAGCVETRVLVLLQAMPGGPAAGARARLRGAASRPRRRGRGLPQRRAAPCRRRPRRRWVLLARFPALPLLCSCA